MKILVIRGTGHVGRLVVNDLRARSGRYESSRASGNRAVPGRSFRRLGNEMVERQCSKLTDWLTREKHAYAISRDRVGYVLWFLSSFPVTSTQ